MEQLFGARIGARMEQLFGARIGARIKQLFGARIRDPKGTAFRGPNRGPNRTTFRGPGLLAVDVFGGSLEATVLHICVHQPSFRGSNGIRFFGARIRDPNGTAFRGPNRGQQLFGARGSWLWMFLQLFGCHCFNLHICVHQPSFRSPNGTRLFGTRIRDPNGTAFRGPNPGPESNDFSARGSWLWIMFFQGLFGGHRFNLHICVHQPSFRGSNGIRLFGARINFSGPGALGCGCSSRGSLEATVSNICVHQPSFRGPNGMTFWGLSPVPEW